MVRLRPTCSSSTAFGQGDDADTRKAQALEQGDNVLLIARQPFEGFGHDHIEPAALCIREKRLDSGSQDHACAGDRRIRISLDDLPAFALRPLAA